MFFCLFWHGAWACHACPSESGPPPLLREARASDLLNKKNAVKVLTFCRMCGPRHWPGAGQRGREERSSRIGLFFLRYPHPNVFGNYGGWYVAHGPWGRCSQGLQYYRTIRTTERSGEKIMNSTIPYPSYLHGPCTGRDILFSSGGSSCFVSFTCDPRIEIRTMYLHLTSQPYHVR